MEKQIHYCKNFIIHFNRIYSSYCHALTIVSTYNL